jgi:2-oxoacid:acceptor oxidoreductase delta subunit (pyruvate/2-ketoisovalerate family)
MELGQPGSDGRRRPTPKAGAPDRTIDATLVLTAIGETPDLRFWGAGGPAEAIEVDAAGWVSFNGADNVLAGGDAVDQPRTVVHALASGKRAAIAADCRRRGLDVQEVLKDITIGAGPALSFSKYTGRPPLNPVPQNITDVVESDRMVFDYFQKTPRLKTDPAPPDRRKTNFEAIWETFNADQAHRAAVRCMHCGRCTECDNCLIFCPDVSVLPSQPGEFGYRIDYDYCKGCGVCAAECPRGAITMVPQESET